ncbi:MAG: sulfatase-like hydrolase/transferase [Prolixibacteraceae bacterium]|nr:sulfatase-like hydrolase/transferase [Prolixibacteraceae bacterium]
MALNAAERPDRVILFMIDGLHWEAPQKLDMPFFNSLVREGTYVQKSYMIIPHHPTIGDYSKFNSCSFPNPMLHTGSVFMKPDNRMVQEVISPQKQTAFVVNVADYRTVSRGFTTSIMDPTLNDDQVVEQSIALLKNQEPVFIRIHLQTPGVQGRVGVYGSTPDKPYYRNIFGNGSPYASSVEHADKLLGELIGFLKKSGKWERTVLIVTSDHGQSKIGWHPLFDEDSWTTPFIITGPGIAKGRELPYLEHTDIAPTIAWILGVNPPNNDGGCGKPVKELMQQYDATGYHPSMYIKTINQQIKEFNILKSRMILEAEDNRHLSNVIASLENELLTPEPFYHQDRIMDWHKAGSVEHLIGANDKILKQMRADLSK